MLQQLRAQFVIHWTMMVVVYVHSVVVSSIIDEATLLHGSKQMGQWCKLLTISRVADAQH
jgi:hypothetical protein